MVKVVRRIGIAPADRPGCSEASNCPDLFEEDTGDFSIIGTHATDQDGREAVIVTREVILAALRQFQEEGLI